MTIKRRVETFRAALDPQSMSSEIWFKRKTFGWGWTPANAKGWLVIILYMPLAAGYPYLVAVKKAPYHFLPFFGLPVLCTAALLWLCYAKGEAPEWRWGKKE